MPKAYLQTALENVKKLNNTYKSADIKSQSHVNMLKYSTPKFLTKAFEVEHF